MVMADSWNDGSVVQMRKIIYTFIALVFFFFFCQTKIVLDFTNIFNQAKPFENSKNV